ncbi:MAG: hypothetical protein QNJ30_15175 [Kiloniellales bacterium]|nr:hypothetical protein [Kiloniellales bacterium]
MGIRSRAWVWGWSLAALGGLAMLLLSLAFDPTTASAAAAWAMTGAFAAAQTGLALVAISVFWRLYQRAARIGTRRDR